MLLRSFFGSSLLLLAGPAMLAGPLVCTTSVEAPMPGSGGAPVEVTVCHLTETTSELVNHRFYTWTSPMARGVDPLHQLTDFLGIAVGGIEGNRVMGFGFPSPDADLGWVCTSEHDGSAAGGSESAVADANPGHLERVQRQPGGHRDHRSRAGCALRRSLPRRDSTVVTLSPWGSSNLVNAANS